MRQFTTQHTVYNFDELSEDAKQKAIENYREGEDFPFLTDDMVYKLEELLKENKIKYDITPNVYYSLSYSQGDSAMFEGLVYWKQYQIRITQSGHYYHYNSKTFDIDLINGNNISMKTYEKTEAEFNELYVQICKELERYGYGIIESTLEDEAIIDMIQANEYEFYADGSMA